MQKQYEPLFTPWKVGNLEIKNRIVLAPMGGTCIFGFGEPNHFDKEAARLMKTIADNNCGLIIPGVAPIKDLVGGAWLYEHKWKFEELKKFMDEVHKTGAKLFVQMTAGVGRSFALSAMMTMLINNKILGTVAKPIMDPAYLTTAPSAVPNRWAEDVTCPVMTKEQIADIVYAFGETARLCKEAGVDGVEIHAVHEGYLLDQFTLPYVNKRDDEYGGSFENRYRFAVEIVQEIKKTCGKDYPVSLRYSVVSKTKGFCEGAVPGETDYVEVGRTMEESEKAAKYLQDAGYDLLNCDNGTYDAWYWPHPPMYMPQNCNLEEVKHIKKFVDIPVVCAGRMTLDVGADAVKNGDIDAVGIGRQFLADPTWLTKVIEDREEDIKPCLSCHGACLTMAKHGKSANDQDLIESIKMCRCAINPASMQSKKYAIHKALRKKKVAIIGGGIGGMEAAQRLKLRGHEPVIYEKSGELGGVFIAAAAPDFKEHDKALIEWEKRQLDKMGIEVHLNTEVKSLSDIKADEYIIATGAKARTLKVPGAEKAMDATDYLLEKKSVGDTVVIIGGGLTGSEIGYDLHRKGKKPIIVEMQDDLMCVKNLCLANSSFLRDYFKSNNVPVYLNTKTKEIGDGYVVIETLEGEKKIPCDSVITSVGYTSTPLAAEGKNVHLIGDCAKVGNLRTAIWGAWDIAQKI